MSDWIFAFFHLFLLLAVLFYAVYSLFQGNVIRFTLILLLLGIYYLIVLHKPVRQELERRRRLKAGRKSP